MKSTLLLATTLGLLCGLLAQFAWKIRYTGGIVQPEPVPLVYIEMGGIAVWTFIVLRINYKGGTK